MFKRVWKLASLGGLGLCALALLTAAQEARETPMTLEQLPEAVRATVLREAAGAPIREIEAETRGGRTVYEAEFIRDGKEIELTVDADGKLLEREEEALAAEQERKVTEADVPAPALAALQKLVGGAKLSELSEEIEHGAKYYEASWKSADGRAMEAEVTPAGDLVELEEQVAADALPAGVLAAARARAGADAELRCEKTTIVLYEVSFRKDNRWHEVRMTPDGRVMNDEDDDEGDDDEKDD